MKHERTCPNCKAVVTETQTHESELCQSCLRYRRIMRGRSTRNQHTFRGQTCRVQLSVWDYTQNSFEALREKEAKFSVALLPASAHPSTPFSHGGLAYYGPSMENAIHVITENIQRDVFPELPSTWRKYLGT